MVLLMFACSSVERQKVGERGPYSAGRTLHACLSYAMYVLIHIYTHMHVCEYISCGQAPGHSNIRPCPPSAYHKLFVHLTLLSSKFQLKCHSSRKTCLDCQQVYGNRVPNLTPLCIDAFCNEVLQLPALTSGIYFPSPWIWPGCVNLLGPVARHQSSKVLVTGLKTPCVFLLFSWNPFPTI